MVLRCNLRHVEGTIVFGILLWKCDLPVLLSVANFSLGILLPLLGLAGPQKCKLLGLLLQICCEQLATALHFTLLQTQPAVHWELAHKKSHIGSQLVPHLYMWLNGWSSYTPFSLTPTDFILILLMSWQLPLLLPQVPLSQAMGIWRLGWWQKTVSLHLLLFG